MRTHIFIALFALVLTACASKQNPGQTQANKQEARQDYQSQSEYVQIMDGASNRGIR